MLCPAPPSTPPSAPPLDLDAQSLAWLTALRSTGTERERALDDLHALLLRAARTEVGRRAAHQKRTTHLDAEVGEGRAEDPGCDPLRAVEWRALVADLHHAVETVLTPRQRAAFVAVVLDEVPVDVVAARTGGTRGALYRTLFDARRKLRAHLDAAGHLAPSAP